MVLIMDAIGGNIITVLIQKLCFMFISRECCIKFLVQKHMVEFYTNKTLICDVKIKTAISWGNFLRIYFVSFKRQLTWCNLIYSLKEIVLLFIKWFKWITTWSFEAPLIDQTYYIFITPRLLEAYWRNLALKRTVSPLIILYHIFHDEEPPVGIESFSTKTVACYQAAFISISFLLLS